MREYFCPSCYLFFWKSLVDRTGKRSESFCSNCLHPRLWAVDSFTFAYFSESEEGTQALKKAWSSPNYAPFDALAMYEKQGIHIQPLKKE